MTRGKQPGQAEIAGGKTYFVTIAGFVAFDPRRQIPRSVPAWQRDVRRDRREFVL